MARAKDSNSHLSHKFLARIAIPGWSPSLVLLLVAPLPWASRLPDNKQGVWCGVLSQGYQAKQRWLSTKYSTCNACFPPYASPSWLTMLNKGKEKVSVAGGKDSMFGNSQMQLTLSRRSAIFLEYTDPHWAPTSFRALWICKWITLMYHWFLSLCHFRLALSYTLTHGLFMKDVGIFTMPTIQSWASVR